jgi:hypothetical protein
MDHFDYEAPAELFSGGGSPQSRRRKSVTYRRFSDAGLAIQFAVEHLDHAVLKNAWLEVQAERYDGKQIAQLYASVRYPLARCGGQHEPHEAEAS